MFKKMEYVYTVYKEQSFTKAAEKLYVSQPCLSSAIRKIEEEIGMPLFERRYSAVRPTEIGKAYLETAERIMNLEKDFAARVSDMNRLEQGSITIGGSNYVSSYILPLVVSRFSRDYPKINISLVETSSVELQKKIIDEEIDLVIDSFNEEVKNFEYVPLLNEQILLAVPAACKCNEGLEGYRTTPKEIYLGGITAESLREVFIEKFENEKFILLKSGHNMHHQAVTIFRENHFTPQVSFRMDQLLTSYALAASGNGVCFVTDTMFKYHRFPDEVYLYRVRGSGHRTLSIAGKKNRYVTRAMERFIQVAGETIISPGLGLPCAEAD
ncbi:MAG: LysR family transcriptional regulator [Lachnospiraceae bacterium]|nr:LysR family transcriptional regulator [Lachnospiraceae bacterium]